MGNKISKKEKARREAEARKKEDNKNRMSFILMCAVVLAVVWGVGYLFNGTALNGLPDKSDVASVEILNVRLTDEPKLVADEAGIKNACSVMDLLRIKYGEIEMKEPPVITVTYRMNDGTEQQLLIGETALRWAGKDYEIKQRNHQMVLQFLDGFFFPEYVTTGES